MVVRPELDIPIFSQAPPLDELSLLPQQILHRDLPVAEDAQMITDDVTVPALWTCDERRAGVVALLGDVVMGAVAAGDASEGELVVGGALDLGTITFGFGLLLR